MKLGVPMGGQLGEHRGMHVTVTVTVRGKRVPVEQVSDRRAAAAFEQAARDVGKRLGAVKCPEHRKPPTNVRVHFEPNGAADLAYDSCCEKLGQAVQKALG
ncbi:MAG: hypothetical protein KC776_08910 [Myxococcales bacterium]|nr:hypothetical protein [Myxococcales bacterium]MCB9578871.1 hypothetical protein [Polyangiaceae bacterium]